MNSQVMLIYLMVVLLFSCGTSDMPTPPATDSHPQSPEAIAASRPTLFPAQPDYNKAVRSYLKVDTPYIALVGAKLIDGTGRASSPSQTILIEKNKIIAVGQVDSVSIPPNAKQFDMRGKTIIPGLVGTHNHMHMPGIPLLYYTAPRMYLAAGVTTIQTTGSAAPYAEMNIAAAIDRGDRAGPDIFHTGPYFTGEQGSPVMIKPSSRAHIERAISYWVEEGVQWFKVYRHIEREDLQAIIEIAHAQGAKVTGHLCSITYTEAAKMGIDAIEHGFIHTFDYAADKEDGICSGSRDFRNTLAIDSKAVKEVQQTLIDHQVAISTTPAIFEAQTRNRAYADQRTLSAMAPHLITAYQNRRKRMDQAGDSWYFGDTWLAKSLAHDYQFYQAGGLLTAGPDPGLHNLPGFGDQRNFELLVEGGFQVVEAIQVMTSNGAQLLEQDFIGQIKAGKRADLVILDGDLEADPSVIKKVEWVFKQGYGFDPKKLLAEIKGQVGYR